MSEMYVIFRTLSQRLVPQEEGAAASDYRPYAFTGHGAVMLATVPNSPAAVHASIQVVRAFVKLRELLSTHRKRAKKLADLEKRIEEHDEEITAIFDDPATQICAVLCAFSVVGFRA
jgi:hypothetical protein